MSAVCVGKGLGIAREMAGEKLDQLLTRPARSHNPGPISIWMR